MRTRFKPFAPIALGVALLAALVLAACGSDDESASVEPNVDGAFLVEMTPHHEGAIEMAAMASDQAEHRQIERLAASIADSQAQEIDTFESVHERLFDAPLGEVDHGTLGLDHDEMGMSMDMGALDGAEPFDRAFIDEMIPHHEGAIEMARIEIEQGSDPEVKRMAREIIAAQSSEIEAMESWRERWYGA